MTQTSTKDAYTVKEVAERLQVGVSAVYELVAGRRIPSLRINKGSIRIPVKEFEQWLQSETSKAPAR